MAANFDWLMTSSVVPKCSCPDCDSLTCFAKRYKCPKKQCSCVICKESKTCLFYPNKNTADNIKQCYCKNIKDCIPNIKDTSSYNSVLASPVPVKNKVDGANQYKKLEVNKEYYDIYVNAKKSKSNLSNPAQVRKLKYGADQYKTLKVNKDFYDIYVNKKPLSKFIDTASKGNQSNTTPLKKLKYGADQYKTLQVNKDYYDIYVNKKPSSKLIDTESKGIQSNPAPIKLKYGADYYKTLEVNSDHYDIYVRRKLPSKQPDPSICCGHECKKRKNIRDCYDVYVNNKQDNSATTKCKQNPPNSTFSFCSGNECDVVDVSKYYYDTYVNKKQSTKQTDTAASRHGECTSLKDRYPLTEHCKTCGDIIENRGNIKGCCDVHQNNKQSSKQTDFDNAKREHPVSGNKGHKVKEYETSECTYDYGNNTTTIIKNQYSHKAGVPKDNDYVNEIEKKLKKYTTQVHNVSVSNDYPCKHVEPSTAKLSAQVMDVSYKAFKESVDTNAAKTTSSKITKLTEYDILKKIKEAYKACSCKVCECVVALTVSQGDDQCNCKPCECIDCVKFRDNFKRMVSAKQVPGSGCPCIRCDRSQCKGISNSDAVQCDCQESTKKSKSCSCKPCQCIDCMSLLKRNTRTWVVAPVEQSSSRNICNCSPCDCLRCLQARGITSDRTQERSTGINRHPNCHCDPCANEACTPDGNASCKCTRHHCVTRKPVSQDSHDYEIRRTTVNKNDKCGTNHDTITMFAAVSNNYPRFMKNSNVSHQNQCSCNTCECLLCKFSKNEVNDETSTPLHTPEEIPILSNHNNKTMKRCRAQWECQICNIHSKNIKNNMHSMQRNNQHEYNVCDSKPSSSSNCTLTNHCKNNGNCGKYSCDNNINVKNLNKTLWPFKNGNLLIGDPKILDNKDMKTNFCSKKSQTSRIYIRRDYSKNCAECRSFEQHQKNERCKNNSRKRKNCCQQDLMPIKKMAKYNNSCEYNSYMQCNKPIFYDYSDGKIVKLSKNHVPNYSSSESSSLLHENVSMSPILSRNHDSWESSCNSSGHDYSDFLVTFPQVTVADYIKDVMEFNIEKDPKLERLSKILYKINAENGKYMKKCNKYHNKKISQKDNNNCPDSITQRFSEKNIYKNNLSSHSNNNNIFTKESKAHKDDKRYDSYCVHKVALQSRKRNNFSSVSFQDSIRNMKSFKKALPLPVHINDTNSSKTAEKSRVQFTISDKQVNKPILNKQNSIMKYGIHSQHSQNNNFMPFLTTDDDFKRVQNTLKQAREFSSQLIVILERYEKANREFESISDKLKMSDGLVINEKIKCIEFGKLEVPTLSKGDGQNNLLNKRESITNEIFFHETDKIEAVSDETVSINQLKEKDLNENQACSLREIELSEENTLKESHIAIDTSQTFVVNNKQNRQFLKGPKDEEFYKNSTSQCENDLSLTAEDKSLPLHKNITDTEKYEQINKQQIVKTFGVRFDSTENIITPRIFIKIDATENYSEPESQVMKQNEISYPDSILDKKLSWNYIEEQSIGTYISLLDEKIQMPDSISLQTSFSFASNYELNNSINENQAFVLVNELANMQLLPTLEPIVKSEGISVSYNSPLMSLRSSSESFKVCFRNLRRISDHTVLIKWNLPRAIDDVQGYELLVDGLPVEKFSPSRCMAVVTCLPRNDKVLLTMRTLTTKPSNEGYYPSANIVYRPRLK